MRPSTSALISRASIYGVIGELEKGYRDAIHALSLNTENAIAFFLKAILNFRRTGICQ